MKNKKRIIIVISVILLLVIGVFLYECFSSPKYADLDPSWGLGTKVTKSISNDRDYEWYIDQSATGRNATKNCGPTSMAMVAKWLDEDTTIKTEDIVDKYIIDETIFRGVDTYTLSNWLEGYDITSRWLNNVSEEDFIQELDEGNIIIVGLDCKYIHHNPDTKQRHGMYWNLDPSKRSHHYVVVKGYKEVDNKIYFETYDPCSNLQKYDDGELIGKDRYYLSNEFIEAATMCLPNLVFEE